MYIFWIEYNEALCHMDELGTCKICSERGKLK